MKLKDIVNEIIFYQDIESIIAYGDKRRVFDIECSKEIFERIISDEILDSEVTLIEPSGYRTLNVQVSTSKE